MSDDRYVHVAPIARGGMGHVNLVLRQEGRFQRLYALKRLHPHLCDDRRVREMFLEEARVAGLIRHPNVVSVLDVGTDVEGPFLLMDFVDGLALSTLQQLLDEGELLPLQICLSIARQAADGLSAAHELTSMNGEPIQLVHRDVSPQNILVGFDGVVRVTDFGVSKALVAGEAFSASSPVELEARLTPIGDSQSQSSLSLDFVFQDAGVSGNKTMLTLCGKFGYMSPEQLRFEPVDPRSDLFAFGVVLWELLCGRRLFRGATPRDTATLILDGVLLDVDEFRADCPAALTELLFELLCFEREGRPASAREVASRLRAIHRTVVLEEEELDVDAFLEDRFRGLKGERERTRAVSVQSAVEESAATTVVRDVTSRSPRGGTIRRWGIIVMLMAAGLVAGWWIQYRSGDASSELRPSSMVSTPAPEKNGSTADNSTKTQTAAIRNPISEVDADVSNTATKKHSERRTSSNMNRARRKMRRDRARRSRTTRKRSAPARAEPTATSKPAPEFWEP